MFRITGGKGFHITFENGYTVSVQFGAGNYCDNYKEPIESMAKNLVDSRGQVSSSDAEVGVWQADGGLIEMPDFDGDRVGGWRTPDQVLELLNWAASQTGRPPKGDLDTKGNDDDLHNL